MKRFRNTQGYLTALGGLIMIIVVSGVRKSTGMLFLEVIDLCDADRSVGSIMISAFFVTSMIASPLAVFIARRIGDRLVIGGGGLLASVSVFITAFLRQIEAIIFFCGVLQGFGYACVYVPTIVLVTKHFKKSMGKAIAFIGMGSLIGSLTIPMVIALSSDRYATPGMFIILSGVSLHLVLAAAIMSPAPPIEEENRKPSKEEQEEHSVPFQNQEENKEENDGLNNQLCRRSSQVKVIGVSTTSLGMAVDNDTVEQSPRKPVLRYFKSLNFYEINLSLAVSIFSFAFAFFLIPPLAEDVGMNRINQAFILQVAGSADVAARIIVGVLCDRFPRHRFHLYVVIMLICVINWLFVSCVQTYASILVFNLISTGHSGSVVTLMVPLIVQTLGLEIVDVSVGFLQAVTSVLLLLLSSLMSMIRENNGSWLWGIYCGLIASSFSIFTCARQMYQHLCATSRRQTLKK